MPSEIVLLTGDAEAPHLGSVLRRYNPRLRIVHARNRRELLDACPADGIHMRRLIAFCTPVIVPEEILNAVMPPAYNFHPGPPTYPGSHVASFAIYDDANMFGATAHEMASKVDSGLIVGVEWFQVPDGLRFTDLELKAFDALVSLFIQLAPHLALNDAPLEHLDMAWAGKATTNTDYERMRAIDETMSEAEIKRRFRAFG